ncbi:hypothetical protein [Burkholderia cenocepacia]|uniref:hypothetical protein n=1 Tax=Burkholderia cenocepacia TaxID=95486 RepID=UPI00158CAA9D|nr:hypothetical protein [Burkholderia cenocepacia]
MTTDNSRADALTARDYDLHEHEQGLYRKFDVRRTDGSDAPGGKHHDCEYFVLDMNHDGYARAALRAYVRACTAEFPVLAADLVARYSLEPVEQPEATPAAPLEGTGNGADEQFERFVPLHELSADAAALCHRVQQGSLSPDDLAAHIRTKIDAGLANARAPRTEVAGATVQPSIEYRYEGGTFWCDLGPAERMRSDFKGVYRLKAGEFPVWAGDEPSADAAAAGQETQMAHALRCAGVAGTKAGDLLHSAATMIEELAARAAASQPAAGQEAVTIYQTRRFDGSWMDSSKESYEEEDDHLRRIVYTAPPAQVATRQGLTDLLRQAREELSNVEWESDPPNRVVELLSAIDALLEGAKHA